MAKRNPRNVRAHMTCICESFGPMEHAALWKRRATPILKRLVSHDHAIDCTKVQTIFDAIISRNFNLPSTCSHHLPWCGGSIRNRFSEDEHKKAVRYLRLSPGHQ